MTVDLSNCDREPIHVPGSIQPHGALLAFDERLVVQQASKNLAAILGTEGASALGQHARTVLGDETAARLEQAFAASRVERLNPLSLDVNGRLLLAVTHAHAQGLIVELEPRGEHSGLEHNRVSGALAALSSAAALPELLRTAVDEVHELTGFDRVLMYRFDDTNAGQVLAERIAAGLESFLDLQFPASDIPAPARRLYLLNGLRYIPDAAHEPSPLLQTAEAAARGPLDLTYAFLRGVSPIHLEYLANLGHRASMSISLVVRGRLWGLISCGHRQPRFVSFAVRTACELIGRLCSMQIAALEELQWRAEHDSLTEETSRIVAETGSGDDVLAALSSRGDALMKLVEATGVAVLSPQGWTSSGAVPPGPALAAVMEWLAARAAAGIAHTDRAPVDIPALAPSTSIASGVLAISLPKPVANAIIWFRPEAARSVRWGGDPDKPVTAAGGRLRPRNSFEEWKQVVRGTSRPWRKATLDAALDLRRHAIELDLALQVKLEQRAVRARNDLIAVVSHDLRNPLNVSQLSAAQLRRLLLMKADQREMQHEHSLLKRIESASGHMNSLINDLLDLTRIENGRFVVNRSSLGLRELIEECIAFHQTIADRKRIELALDNDVSAAAQVEVDRERIFQVLTNLIGNALKFTPEGGHVQVHVEERAGEFEIRVRDDGAGIAAGQLPRVFEKYFQGDARRDGSGLGLFIAKGIVDAHGGRIWVESTLGAGTSVTFTLPRPDRGEIAGAPSV